MSKALVTIGSMTNHGGIVSECDTTFIINGIAVHLNGMKHFCPKCKTVVSAIASDQTTIVNGRAVVLAGDKTTCGAIFLGNQHLVIAQPKSSSSTSSVMSKLNSTQSTISKDPLRLPNTAMSFSGDKKSQPESVFSPDGNRVDNDRIRGALNSVTFGLSEKAFNALGIEAADPKRLESGEKAGMAAATIIGPSKVKSIASKATDLITHQASKIADFIKSSVPGAVTKGRAKQYDKSGGYNQATKDFDELLLKDVKNIPNGKVGKMEDGRMVNVRSKSSDGRPTLEIQNGKNPVNFRYDE